MNAGQAPKLVKHTTEMARERHVSPLDTKTAHLKITWSALAEKKQTLFIAPSLKVSKDELRVKAVFTQDHGDNFGSFNKSH